MFGIIGFIFLFILLLVLFALVFLGNIIRMLFGLGRRAPKQYTSPQETSSPTGSTASTPKKKIFGEDEGEYVEFEEVE